MVRHRRIQRTPDTHRIAGPHLLFNHGRKQRRPLKRRTLVPDVGLNVVAAKPDQPIAFPDILFQRAGLLDGDVGNIGQNNHVKLRQVLRGKIDPRDRLHIEIILALAVAARTQGRGNQPALGAPVP